MPGWYHRYGAAASVQIVALKHIYMVRLLICVALITLTVSGDAEAKRTK